MQVVVLGSGGREHAIAWKLLQSNRVQKLILVPGNDGALEQLQSQYPSKEIQFWQDSIKGRDSLQALAKKTKLAHVDFVVVGPDNALADGAVDAFEAEGVRAFGPTQAAAQLETSKIFAKHIMKAAKVPTAEFYEATSVLEAKKILSSLNWNEKQWVIKADGLALGKGVEICETPDDASKALTRLEKFSSSFVIEERLSGKEISWLAFCDGESCSLFPPARDYKTLTSDPLSPNTGGMGAVCPIPLADEALFVKIQERVFLPVLKEMKKRGTPFKGVLYAGLMTHGDEFWVLEFNARFGDPEAQVLLPLMNDDLLDWCEACVDGRLHAKGALVPSISKKAVYMVAAAPGYPADPTLGGEIKNFSNWTKMHRGFFAGVRKDAQGELLTAGGRVLGALGIGDSIAHARRAALENLQTLTFAGMQVREEIGSEWN